MLNLYHVRRKPFISGFRFSLTANTVSTDTNIDLAEIAFNRGWDGKQRLVVTFEEDFAPSADQTILLNSFIGDITIINKATTEITSEIYVETTPVAYLEIFNYTTFSFTCALGKPVRTYIRNFEGAVFNCVDLISPNEFMVCNEGTFNNTIQIGVENLNVGSSTVKFYNFGTVNAQ